MSRREWSPRLAVGLGYVALALLFTWPLPLSLSTHLTGDPGGDTGVYVWNQWVFQHELHAGASPFSTDRILALSSRAGLSQHNYTTFLNLLALPLIPLVGIVAAFNLVLLLSTVLTALCGYALARLAFPTTRLEAFAGGMAFAWAPALVARTTGHFSLVAAAPLAAFTWCIICAHRSRRLRYAALAGVAMAWAAFCDPYLAVFCLLIAGVHTATTVVDISRRPATRRHVWTRLLDVLILSVAGLVVGLAFGRGGRLDLLGIPLSVRGLYTPVMILTLLVTVRVALLFHATVNLRPSMPWLLKGTAVLALACAGPLSPVLYGLGQGMAEGSFVTPPVLWRSSPRGVDLLAFVHPNPNHVLSRWLLGDVQATAPTVFVEYTAALSLVALGLIVLAVWIARFRPHPGWWWFTAGFAALALGPFVVVAGMNSYVPGPWALLRYVPVISAVRTPTRFALVASLGIAILLAGALAALGARWPHRRRAMAITALVALGLELVPAPRPLYPAVHARTSDIIAADPRPVRVLDLPFGIRDGASSAGNFSARSQFEQTRHGKALIGGYLSRISQRRVLTMTERYPEIGTLLTLSEGRAVPAEEAAAMVASGPAFVERAQIGYVVIDERTAPETLTHLAIEAFRLEHVTSDGPMHLYRPRP